MDSTSSRLLTSRTSVSTRIPYCCSKSSLIAAKRSARRPASNKLSPSLANARAHSRPIPEVAPVTKILRFISIPPLKDGPDGLPKPPPAGSDYALRASQGQSRFWKPIRTCFKYVILISRKDFRYGKKEIVIQNLSYNLCFVDPSFGFASIVLPSSDLLTSWIS